MYDIVNYRAPMNLAMRVTVSAAATRHIRYFDSRWLTADESIESWFEDVASSSSVPPAEIYQKLFEYFAGRSSLDDRRSIALNASGNIVVF